MCGDQEMRVGLGGLDEMGAKWRSVRYEGGGGGCEWEAGRGTKIKHHPLHHKIVSSKKFW